MEAEIRAHTNPILTRIPLAIAGGILFGAFFASLFSPLAISLVAGLCALGLLLFGFFLRRHGMFFIGAIFFFSILLVSGRMLMLQESFRSPTLEAVVGTKTLLVGVIAEDPDVRDASTILTVRLSSVDGAPSHAKVRVSTDHFTDFVYGDEIQIIGVPTIPQSFTTDAGSTFDYPHFLLAHGITYEIKNTSLAVVAHGKGNFLVAGLLSFKHLLSNQIGVILPEPKSALLGGLLLGEKQSLGKHITDAFRHAGVVHMIVLSGYNVSLIANALEKVFRTILPRVLALSAGIVGIIAFAIMTGASETTVRASIMAILVVVATALRRPADALRLLTVAATVMLFLNPYLLLYDLSFQLSCLATFGLIFLSDPIAKHLTLIPEKFSLREVAAATIATEIVVAPLLIISVGQLSVVAIFTNLLVLCAVPWTMLFGFIAVCISFVSTALAFPITTLTYGLLSYILTVAIWFGSLPFAVINIPPEMSGIALLVLAILYATLGWFLFRFRQKIFLIRSIKK